MDIDNKTVWNYIRRHGGIELTAFMDELGLSYADACKVVDKLVTGNQLEYVSGFKYILKDGGICKSSGVNDKTPAENETKNVYAYAEEIGMNVDSDDNYEDDEPEDEYCGSDELDDEECYDREDETAYDEYFGDGEACGITSEKVDALCFEVGILYEIKNKEEKLAKQNKSREYDAEYCDVIERRWTMVGRMDEELNRMLYGEDVTEKDCENLEDAIDKIQEIDPWVSKKYKEMLEWRVKSSMASDKADDGQNDDGETADGSDGE